MTKACLLLKVSNVCCKAVILLDAQTDDGLAYRRNKSNGSNNAFEQSGGTSQASRHWNDLRV